MLHVRLAHALQAVFLDQIRDMRTSRARMSGGNASTSEPTVSFRVSTVKFKS